MGGKTTPKSAASTPRHMYFLEGGLLVITNLLKPDDWVHDTERSHCNVCVQQFMAFRRRHHCRTCGEVVCGGCSSCRKVHMIAVNVECTTRVCSFCMIRATDASIQLNEQVARETVIRESAAFPGTSIRQLPVLPAIRSADSSTYLPSARPQTGSKPRMRSYPSVPSFSKQFSMGSIESSLTSGSVVQLWPNPTVANEAVRMQIASDSQRLTRENDPTMTLLVTIVARTVECPVAFIGILDDEFVQFKATIGWDRAYIPRADCPCALQDKTMIVADTNTDKHFHANNICIEGQPMRYFAGAPIHVMGQCIGAVCAIDANPHPTTQDSMRSTLEAVANIVSEVVEQRVGGSSTKASVSASARLSTGTEDITDSASSYQIAPSGSAPALPTKTLSSPRQTLAMTHSLSSSSSTTDLIDLKDCSPGPLASMTSRETESESEDEDETRAWPTDKVFPWPRARASSYSNRFSLAQPIGPPEVGEKIARAMECFQLLRASRWTPTVVEETVRAFEKEMHGYRFTKSHMTLAGDCTHVIADLQAYDDDYVYADIFASVARRNKLSVQTWTDVVVLRSSIEGEATPMISHWRQYPDSSNIIVAFRDDRQHPPEVSDFLFGWFVAPAAPDENGSSVHVSCIVAEAAESRIGDANLSLEMLFRLEQSLPFHYDMRRMHSARDSEIAPPTNAIMPRTEQQLTTSGMTLMEVDPGNLEHDLSVRSQAQLQAPSALNENERMMLDLLDKTISTQEVLAAQQHVMANVIDYHGTQLERISSALDRVETILSHNGSKLYELGSSDRKSVAL